MNESYNKALTLDDRMVIEKGIRNGSTKTAIAMTLGKDKSTIGKEIKLHRTLSYKCGLPLECAAYRKCAHGRNCTHGCVDYVPFKCARRDRSPGACNGCRKRNSCRFDKYIYEAGPADKEYRDTLSESRAGFNLTEDEAAALAGVVVPLIRNGQSPYGIIASHPELKISEKTLYNYIEGGVFSGFGIADIDLRRKVSRKIPKKKSIAYKKREDRSFLKGRLYADYRSYMEEHPKAHVIQMDTVYNNVSDGPFIQTFKFIGLGLMIGIYHTEKTADSMTDGIVRLDGVLGDAVFNEYAEVCLTDRGSEFTNAGGIETRPDGRRRTRVFYCDPLQSCQKGSLEVNHELLRYILPKEKDLRDLGLVSQEALNVAMSHINSFPVESLYGKSPIEYTRFMAPRLWERLLTFGLAEIPRDSIVLTPYLLKGFRKDA